MHFIHAAKLECMNDPAGGIDLFKTQLRVGVQVTAKSRQFRVELRDLRKGTATGTQWAGGVDHQNISGIGGINRKRG